MIAEPIASPSFHEKSTQLLQSLGNSALAGFVAGFIGLGLITLRGVMRVLTITSGEAGRLTENGNVAGQFTAEGSLFLIGAGAFLGAFLGGLYATVRPVFSGRAGLIILIFAPLVTRLLVLSPDNEDFAKFGPGWVAVVGFTLGVGIYLALLELFTRLLETRWRIPKPFALVLGTGAGLLVVLGVLSAGGASPEALLFPAVVIALLIGLWGRYGWHVPLARLVVIGVAVLGVIAWAQAAIEIA